MNRFKLRMFYIPFILVLLVASCGKSTKNNPSLGEKLSKVSNEMNKHLPRMVNRDMRTESTVGYDNKFMYVNTMVNARRAQFDLEDFHTNQQRRMKNVLCSSKSMALFIEYGVEVIYAYYDKDGLQIGEISFNMGEC